MEEYRTIKGFEKYSVSNLGNVKNNESNKLLKSNITKYGYRHISFSINKVVTSFQVHRLVGLAFLENNENKSDIDHIDQNRTNNILSNLRWATRSQNCYNKQIYTNNTSGSKGVKFCKQSNKWRSQINIDGIRIHLGIFTDKQDAINIRVQRANELFGIYINDCEKIINV
jgi:hypothetical protein